MPRLARFSTRLSAFALSSLLALSAAPAVSQSFPLSPTSPLAETLPGLAEKVLTVFHDDDRDRDLNARFRLQMVAGRAQEAVASIRELRALRQASAGPHDAPVFIQYESYAGAKALEAAEALPFEEAYRRSFRAVYGKLDDKSAFRSQFAFRGNLPAMEDDLRRALEAQQGKESIALADAVDLLRKAQVAQAYRAFQPLTEALFREDDDRRFVVQDDTLVKTPDGARIAVLIARPKGAKGPLPTLFNFTIYNNPQAVSFVAKQTAAFGYVGVVALTRGKGRSPDAPVPYEHDGADAAAVIDWIAAQPWSDGRVGMFGGSYEGFTQWSTAKRRPKALKAIMPSVAVSPGIDLPMEGNVFMTFPYRWMPYATNNKTLDDATYFDAARWNGLERSWYTSGKPYRDLEAIDGHPNPVFRRWLDHPSYDAYWQALTPNRDEFARLDIPVLSTTGYYDGCLVSTLRYFSEHTRNNPKADHTLLIGPWDHIGAQHRPAGVLQGYAIDPAAQIDIEELRYEWYDFLFKGGPKPALLRDRVNFEVMGANAWRNAPSLAAMADSKLRLYLDPRPVTEQAAAGAPNPGVPSPGVRYRLSAELPPAGAKLDQTVDLTDRSDVDLTLPDSLVTPSLEVHNGFAFVGDPLARATELSGLFSGHLVFTPNKRDLDLAIDLYELSADGDYLQLSSFLQRASYAGDRSRRQLLVPGEPATLDFTSGRLTSRQLAAGSRLVAVLRINKGPSAQINYGSGKDVSDESIADAGAPLRIEWGAGSYLEMPVRR